MSAASTKNATSPVQHRDIRSASLPFKRDKEHAQKWSHGQRPLAGVRANFNDELDDSELPKAKVRPMKQWSQISSEHKSHANKNPKPNGNYTQSRAAHKVSAVVESNDHTTSPLSKSLLELLPQHANNTSSPIQTMICTSSSASEAEILYSFDNKGPSPGDKGRKVDFGGLVELAEKKWVSEQTERIVKGEYEVLDNEGEKIVVGKGKKKGSPKQRVPTVVKDAEAIEDDGFELV
jgi:hypothetical protein